ncbi:1283_t:CDS:2 [Dentiscutata erythropus]|uniref:1283_t:CDS:1 n=1 Tax=Dentiscutata erythropus TaxID=1348616 RepID=A0A9N9FKX4_9GLOM|nr:1283_t:CDS:2 [Dentiscutata erythropus]
MIDYDCFANVFDKIAEELDSANTLLKIALVDKKWAGLAIKRLYKDPWRYCFYRSDSSLAKKLINIYLMCLRGSMAASSNSTRGNRDEPLLKRQNTRENIQEIYVPSRDYIAMAENLHIPVLYHCIESSYASTNEITDDMRLEINRTFYQLFKMFINKANIKECTFHESKITTEYPITLEHLDELVTTLFNRGLHLRYLNLGFFNCNNEGLAILTEKCSALETFKIKASCCSDKALADFLRRQRRLTKLKIRDAAEMIETMDAIRSQSRSIVKLRILNCNLGDCKTSFTGIGECTLRSLYMRDIHFTTNTSFSQLLMPIAQNCKFHNIDFSKTPLPVEVLIEIAKKSSTTLRRVHLIRPENEIEYINLSAGIEALARHATNLRHFERNIHPSEINSICYLFDSIGQSLERLEIDSNMDGLDMSNLIESIGRKCRNLCLLNINNFEFNFGALEELVKGCPYLHTLFICESQSVNDRIFELLRNSNLQSLDITGCPNVTDEAIHRFQREREIDIEYGSPKKNLSGF